MSYNIEIRFLAAQLTHKQIKSLENYHLNNCTSNFKKIDDSTVTFAIDGDNLFDEDHEVDNFVKPLGIANYLFSIIDDMDFTYEIFGKIDEQEFEKSISMGQNNQQWQEIYDSNDAAVAIYKKICNGDIKI